MISPEPNLGKCLGVEVGHNALNGGAVSTQDHLESLLWDSVSKSGERHGSMLQEIGKLFIAQVGGVARPHPGR